MTSKILYFVYNTALLSLSLPVVDQLFSHTAFKSLWFQFLPLKLELKKEKRKRYIYHRLVHVVHKLDL